jgi:hypothetical protein
MNISDKTVKALYIARRVEEERKGGKFRAEALAIAEHEWFTMHQPQPRAFDIYVKLIKKEISRTIINVKEWWEFLTHRK